MFVLVFFSPIPFIIVLLTICTHVHSRLDCCVAVTPCSVCVSFLKLMAFFIVMEWENIILLPCDMPWQTQREIPPQNNLNTSRNSIRRAFQRYLIHLNHLKHCRVVTRQMPVPLSNCSTLSQLVLISSDSIDNTFKVGLGFPLFSNFSSILDYFLCFIIM